MNLSKQMLFAMKSTSLHTRSKASPTVVIKTEVESSAVCWGFQAWQINRAGNTVRSKQAYCYCMWIIFKATFLLFTSVSDVFLKITMEEVIVTVWPPYSLKIRKTKQNNFEVIIDFDFFFNTYSRIASNRWGLHESKSQIMDLEKIIVLATCSQ